MEPDTFRGVGTDVYWRRRMALLIGVLVVVAVVAWACSSLSQPYGDSGVAESPTGDPASEALLASLYAAPTATPTPSEAEARPERPSPTPTRRRPGDECDPGDLVVSLSAERKVYPAGDNPTLLLTLVNTGRFMCTTEVGPRALEVRITSGDDRIWSSADCISGEGAHKRRLKRGIPYIRSIVWDRHRSAHDCRAERIGARPGTYVAVARGKAVKSGKVVFHLR